MTGNWFYFLNELVLDVIISLPYWIFLIDINIYCWSIIKNTHPKIMPKNAQTFFTRIFGVNNNHTTGFKSDQNYFDFFKRFIDNKYSLHKRDFGNVIFIFIQPYMYMWWWQCCRLLFCLAFQSIVFYALANFILSIQNVLENSISFSMSNK